MSKFYDSLLFTIMNYVYVFFVTNLYFVLCNFLLLFIFLSVDFTSEALFLLLLAFIPLGPSIGALFYTMGKLVRQKDINPTKTYFKGYVLNFKISLSFGIVQLALLVSLVINLNLVEQGLFRLFFVALITFVILASLWGFGILSRFEMTLKNLCLMSIWYTVKYWKVTLFNLIGGLFALIILNEFPGFVLPFIASCFTYFVMFNLRAVLVELEESSLK